MWLIIINVSLHANQFSLHPSIHVTQVLQCRNSGAQHILINVIGTAKAMKSNLHDFQ